MAPPNPMDLAASSVRTLRAFGRRVPIGGGVLAPSLEDAVGGRVVLITGASSGIGKSTAIKIGEAGGTVLLVARTKEKLDEAWPRRSRSSAGSRTSTRAICLRWTTSTGWRARRSTATATSTF